jgi:hypothetical protein
VVDFGEDKGQVFYYILNKIPGHNADKPQPKRKRNRVSFGQILNAFGE